jgi:GH15 family glucan-1,4-alpha-glucosidase
MARPILLSNGELQVGLNRFGLVHDLYYPYVGLENHTSERALRHRIGVFTEEAIHWLDDGSWQIRQQYLPGRLIGLTIATNQWLGLELRFEDFVDSQLNVLARNIHVLNLAKQPRPIKLFLHQAFIISEAADGHDTAQYLPTAALSNQDYSAILHYKGKRAFLVSGDNLSTGKSFDSFSVGSFGGDGDNRRDGVWRDAEDGQLTENPVERIQTDSILQFNLSLAAHDSARVHYFMSAAKSITEAVKTLTKFRQDGLLSRLLATDNHWRRWIEPAIAQTEVRLAPDYRASFITSLLLTKAMMDRRGALIASTDTEMMKNTRDAYVDCWPRDAANVLSAYLRLDYFDEVRQFFNFARDVITEEGYFWQMYRPDASVGPNSHAWVHDGQTLPPIQADETARVLMLFNQAFMTAVQRRHDKAENWRDLFDNLARPMANFLAEYVDTTTKLPLPSYELWEVRFETTTYTTGLTVAALEGAAAVAEKLRLIDNAIAWRTVASDIRQAADIFWNPERRYFYRGLRAVSDGQIDYDPTIDIASLIGGQIGHNFGLFSDEQLDQAYETFVNRFNISDQNVGAPRFEDDDYHRADPNSDGNPWYIASLWLARFQLQHQSANSTATPKLAGRRFAKNVLDWANRQIATTNVLPEQVNPLTGAMISPAPLAWSHGEFLNACLDYGNPNNDPFKPTQPKQPEPLA